MQLACTSPLHRFTHTTGVMSRDIKLENTLLVLQPDKKPLIKLCDFGYSKHELLDSVAKSKVGTPGYTAPGRCRQAWRAMLSMCDQLDGSC